MKIGLVRRGFSATGGAEAYLLRLAHGLQKAGHEPVLLTSSSWPADRWPGGAILRVPGESPLAFAQAFQARSWPVDVTFSLERVPGCDIFRAGDGVHAAWLRRRSAFESKWRAFLHRYNPKHLALMKLEREVFQTAKAVIANSQMVADEIMQWHDYPRERLAVVPNGISSVVPLIDKQEARRQLGIPADAYCVLFVGTGWERKGLMFLIRAVERLSPGAIALVAGRGRSDIYASPRAVFLGPTHDLSAPFSAADVFSLPTIYDPSSNACLEALAAGLPVVTTTANGFAEALVPDVHGSVVPVGNIPALADALQSWRSHPGPLAACRERGSHYTIERNLQETLQVIARVTG